MKITARISGEDKALVEDLNQRGIKAKLVRGGVIVDLNESESNPGAYEVPPEANGATLCIDLSEHGGGMTNTGVGVVVCGLSGKPLRPYYVPRGGHRACGTHAYFAVPNGVVTVSGYRRDTKVVITEHRIVVRGNVARINSYEIWSGEIEFLPELLTRFKAAAAAAVVKGNCYHCRCVHFAETETR